MLSGANTPNSVQELVSLVDSIMGSYSSSSASPVVLPPIDLGVSPTLTPPLSPHYDNSWVDTLVHRQQTQSPLVNHRRRLVGLGLSFVGGRKSQSDLFDELQRERPEANTEEIQREVARRSTSDRVNRMIVAQKSVFHTMTIPGVPGYEEMMTINRPITKEYSLREWMGVMLIKLLFCWGVANALYLCLRLVRRLGE